MGRRLGSSEGAGSRVKEEGLVFNRRLFLPPPLGLERKRGKMDVDGGVCGFDGQMLKELPTDGLSSSYKWEGGHRYQ